ncbi:histidine phosphatase family protein [Leifsonia sp. TF02-11]|uniref:histidine phosphatase family protein n=1 Tax=Leifsonia sp. TF02-11 TaxID=2815212 RepID=UPI001AA1D0F7|nr:histidine phosphatase family protein [Leifsonia sp. TF02-11]MBO1741457.1 histidine phosphatase family protein [Leifsonia sp. TF02-11]
MRLLLIRHGQTPDNVAGALGTTIPGPVLTALGRQQAADLAAAVTEPIAAIAVSSLIRTHLTAAPLARHRRIDPVEFDGLREIEAGVYEGRHDPASVTAYLRTFAAWAAGDLDTRMPGAEDGHTFFDRYDTAVAAAIDTTPSSDGPLAIVSHGAAIRTWVSRRARNIDASFTMDRFLQNTGMVVLEGTPASGWDLLSWQGEPVAGAQLADPTAADPVGKL